MGITKALYLLEQIRKDELTQDNKIIKVRIVLAKHTTRAVLVNARVAILKVKARLPKSQVVEPDPIALKLVKVGDELTLHIPLWLAKSNNLTSIRR